MSKNQKGATQKSPIRRKAFERPGLTEDEIEEIKEAFNLFDADGTLFDKLDLAPLKPLFEVLGTRQVNRLSTLEGQTRVVTRWIITLQPRNQGFVVIPPLRVGINNIKIKSPPRSKN